MITAKEARAKSDSENEAKWAEEFARLDKQIREACKIGTYKTSFGIYEDMPADMRSKMFYTLCDKGFTVTRETLRNGGEAFNIEW